MSPCENEMQDVSQLEAKIGALQAQLSKAQHGQNGEIFSEQLVELKADLAIAKKRLQQCMDAWCDGTVRPKYKILTVLYAPPGSNNGKGNSSVEYSDSSTAGSSSSVSSSFSEGKSVSASVSSAVGSVKTDFNFTNTTSDSQSVDIKKSSSLVIKVPGPAVDGIDHNRDEIWLWLNPLLLISTNGQEIDWKLSIDGSFMDILFVYVGWLSGIVEMPPDVGDRLTAAGITPDEYPQILAADPFASGAMPIDRDRFLQLTRDFPYEPPFSANDQVTTDTFKQSNDVTQTSTQKVENDYGVSITISASGPFTDLLKASLSASETLKWTDSSTSGTSSVSSQSATFTIGGPAFGYQGPTKLLVYWDTIYNSFLFAFPTEPPSYAYKLVDTSTGQPIVDTEVVVTFGMETFITNTDANGEFQIYSAPLDQVGVGSVGDHQFQISPGVPNLSINIG